MSLHNLLSSEFVEEPSIRVNGIYSDGLDLDIVLSVTISELARDNSSQA